MKWAGIRDGESEVVQTTLFLNRLSDSTFGKHSLPRRFNRLPRASTHSPKRECWRNYTYIGRYLLFNQHDVVDGRSQPFLRRQFNRKSLVVRLFVSPLSVSPVFPSPSLLTSPRGRRSSARVYALHGAGGVAEIPIKASIASHFIPIWKNRV